MIHEITINFFVRLISLVSKLFLIYPTEGQSGIRDDLALVLYLIGK